MKTAVFMAAWPPIASDRVHWWACFGLAVWAMVGAACARASVIEDDAGAASPSAWTVDSGVVLDVPQLALDVVPLDAARVAALDSQPDSAPDCRSGGSSLTIVGDRSIELGNGAHHKLSVWHHKADGSPLPGSVAFTTKGETAGAHLLESSSEASPDGVVEIELVAGQEGSASFHVVAESPCARPVAWQVLVRPKEALPKPLVVEGQYEIESRLNLVPGLQGELGLAAGAFLDMVDEPYDPATWLIDQVLVSLGWESLEEALALVRPSVDQLLYEIMLDSAPETVVALLSIADAIGQATSTVGLVSELALTAATTGGFEGKHVVTGAVLEVDGVPSYLSLGELAIEGDGAQGIAVSLDRDQRGLIIGEHSLTIPYGAMLWAALHKLIVPAIDPRADSLEDLLSRLFDCRGLGRELSDLLWLGSPEFYEAACATGIGEALSYVEDLVVSIDTSGTVLTITGSAVPADLDGDRVVDELGDGRWEGKIVLGAVVSQLGGLDQVFRGTRIGGIPGL
ncbi:MAG: hypothetical protein V2A73_12065 [Pseudomonadota bacterium]